MNWLTSIADTMSTPGLYVALVRLAEKFRPKESTTTAFCNTELFLTATDSGPLTRLVCAPARPCTDVGAATPDRDVDAAETVCVTPLPPVPVATPGRKPPVATIVWPTGPMALVMSTA